MNALQYSRTTVSLRLLIVIASALAASNVSTARGAEDIEILYPGDGEVIQPPAGDESFTAYVKFNNGFPEENASYTFFGQYPDGMPVFLDNGANDFRFANHPSYGPCYYVDVVCTYGNYINCEFEVKSYKMGDDDEPISAENKSTGIEVQEAPDDGGGEDD